METDHFNEPKTGSNLDPVCKNMDLKNESDMIWALKSNR